MVEKTETPKKWSDFNVVLHKERISWGPGKWADIALCQKKGTDKKFVQISRYGEGWSHKFNISDINQWGTIKEYVDEFLKKRGGKTFKAKPLEEKFLQELEKYKNIAKKKGNIAKKKGKMIYTLRTEFEKFRSDLLKNDVPGLRTDLEEFKQLLDSSRNEADVQDWIENHVWILGPEYINAQPQRIEHGGRKDFFVQRYDMFIDYIEIKKPSDKIFVRGGTGPSTSPSPSSVLKNAIAQMIDYLERSAAYSSADFYVGGEFVFKPKGIIIIGRTEESEKIRLRKLNSYLHGIEILTFDDLYQKAKNMLAFLSQKIPKKSSK